jgi:uncharacterized surface protein with fasciclin (FAS1) repeats
MKRKNRQGAPGSRWIILLGILAILSGSCNKALPDATPAVFPPVNNSTTSIGDFITSDTGYSFFAAAAKKTGQLAQLSQDQTVFTVFLPDNNAFRASGIPSLDYLNALPPAVLGGIVGYSIIPGQQYLAASFSGIFPNEQLPTSLSIGALPGTPLPLKLSTFPSSGSAGFFDNNIPVVQSDMKMKNGVIHRVAGLVIPPGTLLKNALYSNPDLSFFKAAIARGDSGQVGLNRLDSLLGYAVTNMTVLAPSDSAFQALIFGSVYGYLLSVAQNAGDSASAGPIASALSASPDVLSNPALFSVLTATTVRGILVYHFLASDAGEGYQPNIRVFSNNFSATPSFYKTLLNAAYADHPGIEIQATFDGSRVTGLQFTGLGTFPPGGALFSGEAAHAISLDNHCVNGVYYVIDKVLLPQ